MKELIEQLNRIARLNGDTFHYNVELYFRAGVIKYILSITEASEGHEFITVVSKESVEDCFQSISQEDLKRGCELWHYKYTK